MAWQLPPPTSPKPIRGRNRVTLGPADRRRLTESEAASSLLESLRRDGQREADGCLVVDVAQAERKLGALARKRIVTSWRRFAALYELELSGYSLMVTVTAFIVGVMRCSP